jgi:hypothetical protein
LLKEQRAKLLKELVIDVTQDVWDIGWAHHVTVCARHLTSQVFHGCVAMVDVLKVACSSSGCTIHVKVLWGLDVTLGRPYIDEFLHHPIAAFHHRVMGGVVRGRDVPVFHSQEGAKAVMTSDV